MTEYRRLIIVSEKLFKMKAGSYSQSAIFVGSIFLLMFAGDCIAAPLQGSVGLVDHVPTLLSMKSWTHSTIVQLSRILGETQVDYAQIRLGDRDYDGYVHRIPGLPRPIWHQDKILEETLLKMEVENLYVFEDFINEMKTRENSGSTFVANFQQIVDELKFLISNIQQMEITQKYPVTHKATTSPQPTRKPVATQKEQDEWNLGVLKELLYWLIPVQGELHRELMNTK